jgi:replicative DNA helicase
MKDAIRQAFGHIENLYEGRGKRKHSVLTGLRSFDRLTNGFFTSDLITVCGRPSVGKSALVLNLACRIAKKYEKNCHVSFISTESTAAQIGFRAMMTASKSINSNIPAGYIKNTDWFKLSNLAGWMHDLPLQITDNLSTLDEILDFVKGIKDKNPTLSVVVVDSLTNIAGENVKMFSEALISLKNAAHKLGLSVVSTTSLGVHDKKAGFLSENEQKFLAAKYSDLVMELIQHETSKDYPCFDPDEKRQKVRPDDEDYHAVVAQIAILDRTRTEIKLIKNKNGHIGSTHMSYVPQLYRFVEEY